MTDLFAQEGITFQHAGYASTAPSSSPDPIPAPRGVKVDNTQTLTAPVQSTSKIDTSAPMSQQDQSAAIIDLYGADGAPGPESAPNAPPAAAAPRDLFAEQGIEQPTITQANANAFNDGISLPKNQGKYGLREDGTPKGSGYFGELKRPDGSISTELSIGVELDGKETQIPALVPTLTQPEIDYLLAGNKPTEEIVNKATEHARTRLSQGMSPFADEKPAAPPPLGDGAPISRSAMSQPDFGTPEAAAKSVQAYAAADDAQIMKLAQTRYTPAQIEEWKNNPITFTEAFGKLKANQVVPGGGLKQLYDSSELMRIADKAKAGEQLDTEDQKTLNDFLDQQIEQRVRGFSWGGNIAYIGSQIPAFVVEFALADGVGKMAQTAAKTGAEEAGVHAALSSATAAATRIATTTALMPGQYAAKYGDRRVNDIMAVTDKGELVLKDSEESPAKSALLAYAHTGADAAAQIAAPGIGKYVVNPAKKLVSTPLISAVNALPTAVKDALYQAYKVIQPNARISKVFTSAGWAGMLEQLGANRVAEALHASLDLSSDDKMTMDQYLDRLTPSKDQLLVEGGLIAIAGGIHTGSSVAFNLMKSKGLPAAHAQETVDNMTAIERDNYVNENLPTPVSAYPENAIRSDTPVTANNDGTTTFTPKILTKPADGEPAAGMTREEHDQWRIDELNRLNPQLGGVLGIERLSDAEMQSRPINEEPGMGKGTVLAGHVGSRISLSESAPDHAMGEETRHMIDMLIGGGEISKYIAEDKSMGERVTNFLREKIKAGTAAAGTRLTDAKEKAQSLLDQFFRYPEEVKARLPDMYEFLVRSGADKYRHLNESYDEYKKREGVPTIPMAAPSMEEAAPPAASTYMDMPMHPDKASPVLYDAYASRTQTDAAEAKEPPPINDDESVFNYLNRALFNRAAAAEEPYNNALKAGLTPKVMENTPLLLSLNHQTPELARSHMMVNTFKWDEDGKIVNTGKALKPTLDDFDNYFLTKEPNRETRRAEFEDFLVARHYLSLLETAPHILVTPEQVAKSKADLDKLAVKYGEDLRMFETFGNEIVSYRNRTRDLLVGTLLTPKQRAEEKKLFPYSIPLKREMEPAEYEGAISRGEYAGLNPGSLTKHLKGSALPVKNILHSIMRETARTIDFVQRNRVNESIYNLKDYAPDKVKETQIPNVKKGTAEFLISYDPKLRGKLEKAAEFFGAEIQRMESIKGGPGLTLGSYSPQESLVRMRIGTTEGTLAHEIGHMLDFKIGLKERILELPKVREELQKLAEDRLNSEHELAHTEEGIRFEEQRAKSPEKYVEYIKNDDEVLANFFDAYVNSPDQVKEVAPHALKAFEKVIDENPQLEFLREIKPSTNRRVEKVQKDVYGPGDLPANTFAFWENGKKVYVKVSKPMFESLSAMRPSQISAAAKFFGTTTRILSAKKALTLGATNTPEFILRNPVRDSTEAMVQSGVGFNPLYIPKTLYGMIARTQQYKEFVQAGGKFSSFMALDDGNIEKTFSDILNPKSKFRELITHPLAAYEKIPKASETLTRFGVYRAALDKGYSPIESAQYALDATLNFPRGGFVTKAANNYIPFLNVGFLATEKLVRAFKQDPATMALRGVTYLTMPALVVAGYYLYGADEQTRNEWLELPVDQISQGRIFFKYNNEWRYIPAPYALGYMFSGLPQMTLRSIHEGNPDDGRKLWEHLLKGFVGAVSPIQDWSSMLPPTLKVMIEDATNFDFYRGRSIYSKFKEGDGVLQKDRTNSYDSETSKAIGNLFNVSPALIDHSMYGLFGGAGGYALKISDAGINAVRRAEGQAVPEKPRTGADVIGEKAFTVRVPEGTRSNSYQGFQQHYLDVQAIASHYKDMPNGPDKAEYQKDNARTMGQLGQLKAAHKQIAAQQKAISAIYSDVHMTSQEKTERIATLEKQITRIARNANNTYNASRKSGD